MVGFTACIETGRNLCALKRKKKSYPARLNVNTINLQYVFCLNGLKKKNKVFLK